MNAPDLKVTFSDKCLKVNNTTDSYFIPVPQLDTDGTIPIKTQELVDYLTTTFTNSFSDIFSDKFFPVGAIYWTSDVNDDPNNHLKGSWIRIEDKFIFAAKVGSSYTGGVAVA